MKSPPLLVLAPGAVAGAVTLAAALQGCSSPSTPAGQGGGTTTSSSASTTSHGTGGTGGATTTTTSSSITTTSSSSSTSSTTTSQSSSGTIGEGGAGDGGVVTIGQLTDPSALGYVSSGPVELQGVVATSRKFLVSKSPPGACQWGVFLSAPGLSTAAPHSAILAVSYGTPASAADGGVAYCPVIQEGQPAGDAFPDDIAPGDTLDVSGTAGDFINAACHAPDAGSTVPQIQLGNVTTATRTATGAAVPAPHVATAAEAASLVAGTDATFLAAWGGARFEIDGVSAVAQQGQLLDVYGQMLLSDGVQVGDLVYYVAAVKTADACHASLTYGGQLPAFSAVRGFVYLDFCTWDLQPADKCHDLAPPSSDCASVADAGVDASAGAVCLY
jgi:hypothetical protein